MCRRGYLVIFILVCFPGVLHAQSAAQPCPAPALNGGYLVPEQDVYSHGTKLTYACDNGRKPAVEGWWATSTCHNGSWFHEPQCIDEKACFPPVILNAKHTVDSNGWYQEGHVIRVTCQDGYEHKNNNATAECVDGKWSSVPVCERSNQSCGEPPKVLHAVIIHQEYNEVFPVDTGVQYECEDGYNIDGEQNKKIIFCNSGRWSTGPVCSRRSTSDTDSGGSAVGGTTRPGSGSGSGSGGSAGGGTTRPGSGSGSGGSAGGGTTRPGSGSGSGGSTGGGEPAGTGSSGSSGTEEKEPIHRVTTVDVCGKPPVIPNGDVVGNDQMFLRYQCANFYKQVGPEAVLCFSDGTWSEVPTCKAAFCSVNTGEYPELVSVGLKYIKDGDRVQFDCVHQHDWWTSHSSVAECVDGKAWLSRCCSRWQHYRNNC